MGISYVPAISAGLLLPSGILQQIGQTLGDTENTLWIPGGWSVGSAVSFAVAGGLSDIFGRRWVLISGQALTLIGCVRLAHSSCPLARRREHGVVMATPRKTNIRFPLF